MMKWHKNLCNAIVIALQEIDTQQHSADAIIAATLKSDKRYGSRDRAFLAKTLYDIIRWKRWLLETCVPNVNSLDFWSILGVYLLWRYRSLPDWNEFKTLDNAPILLNFEKLHPRAIRESIPDWLDKRGVQELGESFWEEELHAQNKIAPTIIRANELKISSDKLQTLLATEGIETLKLLDFSSALQLIKKQNIVSSSAFKRGLFEFQDASSQLIAPFLDVSPHMLILDTCAGAGGKTLHLASLTKNTGQIVAMDIYSHRLQTLEKRAKKSGASNIEMKLIKKNRSDLAIFNDCADRVLIDIPCSGLGILRRNPNTKWTLSPTKLEAILQNQATILSQYSKMVKPNGKLVYASCSILPSENRNQIATFLKKNPYFELEEDREIYTHRSGFDGFYMAKMIRKH